MLCCMGRNIAKLETNGGPKLGNQEKYATVVRSSPGRRLRIASFTRCIHRCSFKNSSMVTNNLWEELYLLIFHGHLNMRPE